jgi:hypothetical protein
MDMANYLKDDLLDVVAKLDFEEAQVDGYEEEDEGPASSCGADMHFMIEKMLEPYKQLQDAGGFMWKLWYKGQTHDVHFIPFIMFVKGDAQELDKHCGKYTMRGSNVAQLCRYCVCPTEETDNPYKRHARKSPQMIQPLIDCNDEEGLKAMSQQNIKNCWYPLTFGKHNTYGIHGAAPTEILHWLQIGKFKYARNNFFAQAGEQSALGNKIDALCVSLGTLFARQSDRDLPRTRFSKGTKKGKLQGHEMTGLLLIMAAALRTQEGQSTFAVYARGQQTEWFSATGVRKWAEYLERCLQWEQWLRQPEISVEEVQLSEVKVREIMQMEKEVGKREKGMGCKTFNFHASCHIAEDMLDFGVPRVVNTDSNESHHKPDKTAALRTQRRPGTFDMQCAEQIHDMDAVEYGMLEIEDEICNWHYFEMEKDEKPSNNEDNNNILTGTAVRFWLEDDGTPKYKVLGRMEQKKKFKFHVDLIEVLVETIRMYKLKELLLYTEHKRKQQIFRGSPFYQGKPWMDWVMIDWGAKGILPGQIWIFVDFRDIAGWSDDDRGIFAMCESANPVKSREEVRKSELFEPFEKETKTRNGRVTRNFYIVDTESFHAPACVIPDLGNIDDTRLLRLKPKSDWAQDFSTWLRTKPKKSNFPSIF